MLLHEKLLGKGVFGRVFKIWNKHEKKCEAFKVISSTTTEGDKK